jgi:hypothetical protein
MAGVVMNDKTMGYDVETALFKLAMGEKILDSSFSINMEGQFLQRKESVVERADRANPQLMVIAAAEGRKIQVVELHKGPKSINAMPALVYAEGVHTDKGVSFRMQAETRLTKPQQSLQRPAIAFDLQFGDVDTPSPVDQTQALQIWDTLVNSMRLSPANGGQRVDPQTGAMVPPMRVGQACPKAGTWEASLPPGHPAAGLLASAASRFVQVQAGQVMPEVYASFMSRTADADNAQVVWTLVRAV